MPTLGVTIYILFLSRYGDFLDTCHAMHLRVSMCFEDLNPHASPGLLRATIYSAQKVQHFLAIYAREQRRVTKKLAAEK